MLSAHAIHDGRAVHLVGVVLLALRFRDDDLCADACNHVLRGLADEEEDSDQQKQDGNKDCAENVHAGAKEIPDAAAEQSAALHFRANADQFARRHVTVGFLQCAERAGVNEGGKEQLEQDGSHGFLDQLMTVEQSAPHHGEVAEQERQQEAATAEQSEKGKADAVTDNADGMRCRGIRVLSSDQMEKHTNKQEHRKSEHQAGHNAVDGLCGGGFPEIDGRFAAFLPVLASAVGVISCTGASARSAARTFTRTAPLSAPVCRSLSIVLSITAALRFCVPERIGNIVPTALVRWRLARARVLVIGRKRIFIFIVLHTIFPFFHVFSFSRLFFFSSNTLLYH